MDREVIPDDAVMAMEAIGIPPYYVPALTIVDTYGLTDAAVARHPVETKNRYRVMAHDRRPPPGYLEERRVNFIIHPPAESALWALARANYAIRVGPELWMPFDTPDHRWAVERFSARELRMASDFEGIRVISNFEDGMDGWQASGDGIGNRTPHEPYLTRLPSHWIFRARLFEQLSSPQGRCCDSDGALAGVYRELRRLSELSARREQVGKCRCTVTSQRHRNICLAWRGHWDFRTNRISTQ